VARLCRVQEESRGASARKGRRELAGDVTGLADAAHDHTALAAEAEPTGRHEALVETGRERRDGACLDCEGAACSGQQAWRVLLGGGRDVHEGQ
jgi:hypothetical protein